MLTMSINSIGLKTKKKEKDYGLIIVATIWMILYVVETNPMIRASLILSITILLSIITYLNWWVRGAL